MVSFLTALGAAVLLGVGFVLQQHRAAEEPAERALTVWLLVDLVRSPTWLLGIGAMVGGQLLSMVALAHGGLGVTEPLLSTNLLFAVLIGSLWYQQRPCRRDWVGALVLSGGLAGFLLVGNPGSGHTGGIPPVSWVLALGGVAAVAAVLVASGRSREGRVRAALLAAGAGVLYGLQDALTTRALAVAGHGIGHLVTSWTPYTLLVVAIAGLLAGQSAFQAAPLSASLPPVTAAEPLTGIALGAGLFGGALAHSPLSLAVEVSCLATMVVGIWVVASSPLVAARAGAEERAPGATREAAAAAEAAATGEG